MNVLEGKFIDKYGQDAFDYIKNGGDYSEQYDKTIEVVEEFRGLVSEIGIGNIPSKRVKDHFFGTHVENYMDKSPDADEELIKDAFRLYHSDEEISEYTKESYEFFEDVAGILWELKFYKNK